MPGAAALSILLSNENLQCDQMAKLFLNIYSFRAIKSYQID